MKKDTAVLRLPEVIDAVQLSKGAIYQGIKRGEFPAPIKLTRRAVGWRRADIDAWIAQRGALDAPATVQAKSPNTKPSKAAAQPETTLRDRFAGEAMNGLLASGWCADEREIAGTWMTVARDAYKMADAMLKARGEA